MNNLTTRIMDILKRATDGYCSGQMLSVNLGISRAAVWKHISTLRGMGYNIDAIPSKGYKLLNSDRPFNAFEITSGLKTEYVGKEIHFYKKLDSTNDTAFKMAKANASEGTVVVADYQEAGRGRLGRKWESPPGGNIYTSIILRPPIPPHDASKLTLLTSVAVSETIGHYLPHSTFIKWPNDILIGSRKISGILAEMDSEMDRVNFIIIGIGVNVNVARDIFPEELRCSITSLKEETGKDVSKVEFLQMLYFNLEKWYRNYLDSGFEHVKDAWQRFSSIEGKAVTVRQFDDTIQGTALGIDKDGALILLKKTGDVVKVVAGDVVIRR
ncbi:MAG: biotin--[acetyl-CoA-carboxylase] ligase [Thermodesulfobacteriota bacterium]